MKGICMQNKEISEALAAPDGGKTDLGFSVERLSAKQCGRRTFSVHADTFQPGLSGSL
jgi:hypothetical protein